MGIRISFVLEGVCPAHLLSPSFAQGTFGHMSPPRATHKPTMRAEDPHASLDPSLIHHLVGT